jgi:hypothetical protein
MPFEAIAQELMTPINSDDEHALTISEQFSKEEARLESLESERRFPGDATAEEAGIKVLIKPDKHIYTVSESVILKVEINNGKQYLLTEEPPCNDIFLVNIFIRDSKGKRLQLSKLASHKREDLKALRKWRAGLEPEPAYVTFKRSEAQKKSSPGAIVVMAGDIRTGGGEKCIGSSIGVEGKMVKEFNVGNFYAIPSPGNYYITYSARMILRDPVNFNLVKQVHISETTSFLVK